MLMLKSQHNFKFKYFYSLQNLSNDTPLAPCDVPSNSNHQTQSLCELATLKGKELAIKIPLVCLSPSNSFIESPTIDSIEKLVEILDQSLSQPKVLKLELINQN
jgi:hypothetical protein